MKITYRFLLVIAVVVVWVLSLSGLVFASDNPVTNLSVDHKGTSLDVSFNHPSNITHAHITYTYNSGQSWHLVAHDWNPYTDNSTQGTLPCGITSSSVDSSTNNVTFSFQGCATNTIQSTSKYIVAVRVKVAGNYGGWVNSSLASYSVAQAESNLSYTIDSVTARLQPNGDTSYRMEVVWAVPNSGTDTWKWHIVQSRDSGTSWTLLALDKVAGDISELVIDGTEATYTIANPETERKSKPYMFGVRVDNGHGWGAWTNSNEEGMAWAATTTVVNAQVSLENPQQSQQQNQQGGQQGQGQGQPEQSPQGGQQQNQQQSTPAEPPNSLFEDPQPGTLALRCQAHVCWGYDLAVADGDVVWGNWKRPITAGAEQEPPPYAPSGWDVRPSVWVPSPLSKPSFLATGWACGGGILMLADYQFSISFGGATHQWTQPQDILPAYQDDNQWYYGYYSEHSVPTKIDVAGTTPVAGIICNHTG